MPRTIITVGVLVTMVGLIVVALVASQVGGARIRASHQISIGQLLLSSDKVLPGVPVNVRYDMINVAGIEDASMIMVRTSEESVAIGEVSAAELGKGRFTVRVPCSSEIYEQARRNKARFVLVSGNYGVLAQSGSFSILPPGPDCIYK
jgi:hypothetical protein